MLTQTLFRHLTKNPLKAHWLQDDGTVRAKILTQHSICCFDPSDPSLHAPSKHILPYSNPLITPLELSQRPKKRLKQDNQTEMNWNQMRVLKSDPFNHGLDFLIQAQWDSSCWSCPKAVFCSPDCAVIAMSRKLSLLLRSTSFIPAVKLWVCPRRKMKQSGKQLRRQVKHNQGGTHAVL